jgi:hypothetical protein
LGLSRKPPYPLNQQLDILMEMPYILRVLHHWTVPAASISFRRQVRLYVSWEAPGVCAVVFSFWIWGVKIAFAYCARETEHHEPSKYHTTCCLAASVCSLLVLTRRFSLGERCSSSASHFVCLPVELCKYYRTRPNNNIPAACMRGGWSVACGNLSFCLT